MSDLAIDGGDVVTTYLEMHAASELRRSPVPDPAPLFLRATEPLPELKPYESYTYESSAVRSPFMPGGSGASSVGALRPDSRRNREFLEQFSLDTLRMVGTLRLSDRTYGLIKTKDGLVHRVLPGNYLGQADGRVTDISPSKISVVEIVPDGLGGYMERPASLALN
jgi:type IV pilus assembly protein PilP